MNLKKLNGMYKLMESSLNDEDKPCVGIFWYSPAREECFGVVKAKDGDSNYKYDKDGLASCSELHKYVWAKEYNYRKYHPSDEINLFIGDYRYKPRGRVFYDYEENKYYVMTGHWIYDYPEARDVILREFNLNGSPYEFGIGIHWEIGMGYGE
jgi:hypothetical protein